MLRNIKLNMLSVLVLSTLFIFASAVEKGKENDFIGEISMIVTLEASAGADALAAFWDKNEKTDQQSIGEYLEGIIHKVFTKVEPDVIALVKKYLRAAREPKGTDMYNVLKELVNGYIATIAIGRAKAVTKNNKMKNVILQLADGENIVSNSITDLYNGIANKNITEEEKTQLVNQSQKKIDAFIKESIKADNNSKSQLASRSGGQFFSHYLQQQQQKYSSSVAQRLTQQMSNNIMCSQPNYCPLSCTSIYGTDTGSTSGTSFERYKCGSFGSISGGSGSYGTGGNGYSISNSNSFRLPGSSYDTVPSPHEVGSYVSRVGQYDSQSHSASSLKGSYSGIANLWSLNPPEKKSTDFGNSYGTSNYGRGQTSSGISGTDSFGGYERGVNSFGSGLGSSGQAFQTASSNTGEMGSSSVWNQGSRYGSSGSSGIGISGSLGSQNVYYNPNGMSNSWSLGKSDKNDNAYGGSRYGGSSLANGRLGGTFGETSYNGGLGNVGGGRQYGGHYSASHDRSRSSSDSDREASHVSWS